MDEFRGRLGETPHSWIEWASSQLLQNTALHPLVEWGKQRFGGPEVAPESRLADLESTLTQVKLDSVEFAPLLAPCSIFPTQLSTRLNLRPTSCDAASSPQWSLGCSQAPARNRSCSRSKTSTGPTRPRLIC